VTDDEVVADAVAAWDAGAAVIHLRARCPDGVPSSRAEHFAPLIERIRAAGCDAILELACGAPDAAGLDCLALRPEIASIDCWGGDVPDHALEGSSSPLRRALAAFQEVGTASDVRCHDLGHVRTLLRLREEGLLKDPLRVQLVVDDGMPDPIEQVLLMSSLLPSDAIWSVSGIGAGQLRLNVLCLIAGGHVRTGLEDNVWLVEDVPATNEELVQRVVRIVDELDRPLATPEEAREILRLGGPGRGQVEVGRAPARSRTVDLRIAAG
jgi:3-keto-5-aminohexanoate cleavage enzyme